MQSYALLFLLALAITSTFAQPKYKDLVPGFETMGRDELRNTLKEYLLVDLDHPNANFRLALIYESNYKGADVLTRYEYAIANATQARLRFTKARQLVDQRDVERNNEFYSPLYRTVDAKGRPFVEFSVISEKINRGLDSSMLFLNNVPAIYHDFTKSVNHYDNAVRIFSEINSEFLSLDDIYLYFDPSFDRKLTQLKTHYDSARHYFDQYLALTKSYPIPHHRQKYHVKPIITYRLDGLITRMNFLTPDIEFWDYGAWVERVRKSVSDEILSLRSRLIQNEIRLNENLQKIAASNGEGVTAVSLDKQVVFNLNNYEKQSLVLALLEYKQYKQDWLLKTKTFVADTANGERNAMIYSTLIYSNRTADTLLNTIRSRNTKEKIRKHGEFIEKYYGGKDGLLKYVETEQEEIRVTYEQYTGGLRSALLNMVTAPLVAQNAKAVRFNNKWTVPLTVQVPNAESLAKGDPITVQSRRSPDGSLYLAGIYKPDKKTNLTVAYVARVMPDGKPGWMQSFAQKVDSLAPAVDANNLLGPFELTQEGCVFVVRATHLTQPTARNVLIYLNEKGEEKFRVRLADRSVARRITFTERTNSFVLLLKGQDEVANLSVPENLTLVGINALGDRLWRRQVTFAGEIIDFVNLIDGHMLAGNYTLLRGPNGQEHVAKAGESNPFLVRFSEKGDIEKVLPITTSKPVHITNLVKVSDRSINLVGKEGNLQSSPLTGDDQVIHIMSNRLCEIVCTNLPR